MEDLRLPGGGQVNGRRLPDGSAYAASQRGDYWRTNGGVWMCRTPDGSYGNLEQHQVTEHEDGTITVSPSIRVTGGRDGTREYWHGYLERGVWRSV